jgi:ubiquinone/menaquinone biosynthesis C-methylase UbiE
MLEIITNVFKKSFSDIKRCKKNYIYKPNYSLICGMESYYSSKLSAEKLKKCYEIAPPLIRKYLDSELNYVLKKINPGSFILELGCGYGRILPELAVKAGHVVGIDTSMPSIEMGRNMLSKYPNITMLEMNAVDLKFEDNAFDAVICIQNGISAFHVNQFKLIYESIRVTKSGGVILFSSYSEKIWNERLEWFKLQANEGLIGEIDYKKTGNGVIVCKDGFTAGTVGSKEFKILVSGINNIWTSVTEVDESSIFLQIIPDKNK